ncbi:Hsp20 family protein [Vulgatibacter incomptus]
MLLPRGTSAEPIDAELRSGVLRVRLSRKPGEATARTIPVR